MEKGTTMTWDKRRGPCDGKMKEELNDWNITPQLLLIGTGMHPMQDTFGRSEDKKSACLAKSIQFLDSRHLRLFDFRDSKRT